MKFIEQVPTKRLVIYFCSLILLPFIILYIQARSTNGYLDLLSENIQSTFETALTEKYKQSFNTHIRNYYADEDPIYLERHIESIEPLQSEVESIQSLLSDKKFLNDTSILNRLNKLTGESNRLRFTESNIQTHPLFQEAIEKLNQPVELNTQDLLQILNLIERDHKKTLNQPHLIITDFELEKKVINTSREVFQVNFTLLKRTY